MRNSDIILLIYNISKVSKLTWNLLFYFFKLCFIFCWKFVADQCKLYKTRCSNFNKGVCQFDPVWHCDFIPCLRERTLHVDPRDCDAILHWILKTAHALPVPDSQESDFMLEWTAVPRLHEIGMSFCIRMKILLWYSYWGELAPVSLIHSIMKFCSGIT